MLLEKLGSIYAFVFWWEGWDHAFLKPMCTGFLDYCVGMQGERSEVEITGWTHQ